MCSLDEDLQGMNLSLQLADLDDGDDDRFDIVRGDLLDIGDDAKLVVRFDLGGEEKASSRREVSDIVDGRLIPLFLLCVIDSMFFLELNSMAEAQILYRKNLYVVDGKKEGR